MTYRARLDPGGNGIVVETPLLANLDGRHFATLGHRIDLVGADLQEFSHLFDGHKLISHGRTPGLIPKESERYGQKHSGTAAHCQSPCRAEGAFFAAKSIGQVDPAQRID